MKNKFDKKIIHNLRCTINSNNNFVMNHFSEYIILPSKEKKNLWNKLCSCMDWIEVAISGLQQQPNFDTKNLNKGSLEFAQFILTIDMLSEAVKNLWLTFSLSEDIKNYPLKNSRKVFEDSVWNNIVDDDIYFKHLRTFFGFHSVNGNEVEVQLHDQKEKVRFFSSWSTSRDGKEFRLYLYSNNHEAQSTYGGQLKISVEKLINYAYNQYHTLIELSLEIENFYKKTMHKLASKGQILLKKNSTPLEKMLALKEYSLQTIYLKDYYKQDIDWYIKFLQADLSIFTEKDRHQISAFLDTLEKKVIPAYKQSLETMSSDSSEDIELISISSENITEFQYHYSKVFDFCEYSIPEINPENYEHAKISNDISLDFLIKNKELPEYAVNLSKEQLYLFIHAKAFHESKKN
ncbi:hypothetical protein IT82_02935 [Listeria monocytogenes]|uniref:hypothetical protein n=1 Tax=Listeria monocytogenes TaxID=1639 RepID=UPI0010BBDD91|nr:hypothetical protein [Listeria monocytogenes]EAC8324800.1 hypothetical protein [Listeria monocytogenes]EAC8327892.1 hypothetical protein [Listeria monocytogenes]EAC8636768.1 hypothetical protein [Listeria monocytogenes]